MPKRREFTGSAPRDRNARIAWRGPSGDVHFGPWTTKDAARYDVATLKKLHPNIDHWVDHWVDDVRRERWDRLDHEEAKR
jgi:hypothetical protein